MKLNSLIPAFALMLLPSLTFAAPVTYPGPTATDSSTGASVTSGVTAAVTSVTDLDGNAIASPGAVAHVAGGNTSVVYDAAAHGEAWVTETLTASGHTFAPIVIFCSSDPSTLGTINTQTSSVTRQADMTTVLAPVKAKTDTLGTNAADSPNAVTAQGQTAANGTAITGLTATVTTGTGVKIALGQTTTASNFVPAPTAPQIAAVILKTPGNLLATDTNGNVGANNFPVTVALSNGDETALGLIPGISATVAKLTFDSSSILYVDAKTLPGTAPAGYGGGTGTVTVGGYAAGQDPATLLASSFGAIPANVLSRPLGHGMTVGQLLVLLQASNGPGAVTNTWNAVTHTLTTAYQFAGDSGPIRSDGTVYPSTQTTAPPVISRTTTLGTVPQP